MPADASHAAQAEALAALLDALQVPRATVMAVSAGAQPATHLALRHPERVQVLVLITPALHIPPPPGVPPASGPPGFVLDYVLASDFIVWVLAHTWRRTCWCGSPACRLPWSVRSRRSFAESW